MTEFIDNYCERLAPGLLAEPLNLVTNLAFFLAAWFAWRLARRHGQLDAGTTLLLVLMVAIGTGSSLFHAFAAGWAEWADVIPILLFQIAFIWLYSRRVMGAPGYASAGLLLVFFGLSWFFGQFAGVLNNSLGYAPAILTLLGLGAWHHLRQRAARSALLAAGLLFLVSIAFRTVDLAVCSTIPIGTHFIWHSLNGLVLYLALYALLVNGPRRP